jgi:hypothetical protein
VRGEHDFRNMIPTSYRTIPTRVGRTHSRLPSTLGSTDHPHACGENGKAIPKPKQKDGPSPRVWGERLYFVHAILQFRTQNAG